MVTETDRFVVVEPYAPRFPFETWIMPKRHHSHFEDADSRRYCENLAWVLKSTLRKIEKMLERPPYNFLIHTRRCRSRECRITTGTSRSFRS